MLPGVTEDDASLVLRCRSGDPGAWDALVDRYARYVATILRSAYRLPDADAEDVFQDVFATVYERLGTLRDPGGLRPWIARITRNAAVDRLRVAHRERPAAGEALDVAHVDRDLERIDLAVTVRAALVQLPDTCIEVLDRFFARDESYATIGDELGIPPGTIASRISRCLTRMRQLLAGEGRTPAAATSG